MKKTITVTAISFMMVFGSMSVCQAGGGFSQAAKHSGQAVLHSAQGLAYGLAGATQVVAGVVAVPFAISGAAGKVSEQVGDGLWDAATMDIGEPLEITDETVSAGPAPDSALQEHKENI